VQLAPENPRYYHQRAYVQASLSNAGDEESEQLELDDYFKILTMPYDVRTLYCSYNIYLSLRIDT
jgi:hypothetical protein